ncbi:MAG: bifunctional glutamate N-acetyltransferase/amino-acid acetyltransferase ArgJ [Candidatus Sumerlaeaceae bacterium]
MTTTFPSSETSFVIPAGFRWAGIPAGIKYKDRRDFGICIADKRCATAAVFTQNQFAAAPVQLSRQVLERSVGFAQGIVVNSGCANAATGKEGLQNARGMAAFAAAAFGLDSTTPLLVCSTGTIGTQLPMPAIHAAVDKTVAAASASATAFMDFATSILTTDTCHKIASTSFQLDGQEVRILACAKGSGMMQPKMATMLAFLFTDAQMDPIALQECLSHANERSLNCVTVDGDTSTNDTAILMASGSSGADTSRSHAREMFSEALLQVLQSVSKQLARDGEGASKLIEVEVRGAHDFISARSCALAVANSPLVKTAVYGRDANWGRIAMAIGNANVPFQVDNVTISLGDLVLFQAGAPLPFDEAEALAILTEDFVRINVELGTGAEGATVWTCDLTERYIEINGSYRT